MGKKALLLGLVLVVVLDGVLVGLRDELEVLRVVVGREGGQGAPVVPIEMTRIL